MKRKYEAVKNYPGIYRILVWNEDTKKFQEPMRGKKFFANLDVGNTDGKRNRIKRHFRTFVEAKEFRAKSIEVKDIFKESLQPKSAMTFKELCDRWVSDRLPHLERTTQVRYRSYLKHFGILMDLEVDNISPSTIDSWIGHVKRPEYLKTMHPTRCGFDHEFSVLREILNYYTSRFKRDYRLPFLRDHGKMLKVREKTQVKKDLSIEEFRKFSEALHDLVAGTRHEVIYYIALMQYAIYGRIQDTAALHFEDFDFQRKKILVRRKIQWARVKGEETKIVDGAKANGGKEIPMNEFAAKIFHDWTKKSGIQSGLLFQYQGNVVTYRQIAHRYDQALKKANLPFTGTHLIRHASLSEHYATCSDILATAKVAGHSDLRATERYAKARDEQVIETQQKMNVKLQGVFAKQEGMVPIGSQNQI